MQRLVHTIPQASEAAQTGRTKLYAEIAAGRLRVVKVGRKTLIRDEELRRWLAQCEADANPHDIHALVAGDRS